MSQDSKPFKRLRADEIDSFENWSLPQVGSPASVGLERKESVPVQVIEEEIAAEKITVSELESIRETARLEGLAAGLEEGRAEGQKQGKEAGALEGKEQGYQEGFAQGEAEVKRLQGMLQQMLTELESPVESVAEDVEKLLLTMVVELSEKVVGRELALNKNILQDAISSALQQLPESSGAIKLQVNVADHQFIKDVLVKSHPDLEVVDSDAIAPGGFKMETLNTLVKHEVEDRFAHVAEQFLASGANPEVDDEQGS